MKKSTFIIIIFLISISAISWLVSIRQYDTMMSSMMMFYNSPVALSLYVMIWTAGMAAMMFPAIIPMILFYNDSLIIIVTIAISIAIAILVLIIIVRRCIKGTVIFLMIAIIMTIGI
jgi:hypothetical protein